MAVDFEILRTLLENEHLCFVKSASASGADKWKALLDAFRSNLEANVYSKGLSVDSSWGIGRWAYIPWIRLSFPDIGPKTTDGIFVSYLFGWEDHEVLLTLNQGVDGNADSDKINETKKTVQDRIDSGSFEKTRFGWKPVLYGSIAKIKRAKSYAGGMIFHKKYTLAKFEPERLESDLQELLNIYTNVWQLWKDRQLP